MIMKKSIVFLSVLALAMVVVGTAEAYRGDPNVKGPNYSADRHATMEKAFAAGDYETWKSLMSGRGRASQVVTKENFPKFVQARELASQGKTEEARALRQELGLGLGQGQGKGGGGNCNFRNAQ